ncbi:MAG: YIP1 family protein [Spirochaetes bacterium]|nr:YIP1 family protein [Spirochaetota bacterium]
MAEYGFNFQKLIEESKSVLTSPKQYFSSMAKTGGFVEPIIKALIYGIVAGIISLIWSLLSLTTASSMGMFGAGAAGIMILIWAIVGAIIGLFIGGIIILIISAICGGSTNFETNVRVAASLMVLSPVSALLAVLGAISISLGVIVSLIVMLYGIYLLYVALVNTLGAKEGTSKIVSIVLGVIILIFMLGGLMCASTASKFSSDMMKNVPAADSKEIKEMQEKLKELQELQKKME